MQTKCIAGSAELKLGFWPLGPLFYSFLFNSKHMEHFEFYPTCIINVMLTLILIFCTAEANQSLQEQKWDQSLIYEPLKGWTLPSYENSISFSDCEGSEEASTCSVQGNTSAYRNFMYPD